MKTWESETDCVPTLRPPADLTAAMTCRISRALAAIAALALAARTSTPNEKEAEVGTPLTEPLPATVIESLEAAAVPSTACAPSGRATPAMAAATSRSEAARAMRFIGSLQGASSVVSLSTPPRPAYVTRCSDALGQ